MFPIFFPADQHYVTPKGTWENMKVVSPKPCRVVNVYAMNSGAAKVFLGIIDTPDGTVASATKAVPYPIESGSFISIAEHFGNRIEGQLVVEAFTDATLTTPAGNVMFYKIDWMAYI
jgi:hypothetical protein